jgi:hypothetical protein
MPYNPSVNDRSGEILAGYKTRSAEITAAGNEALTEGIVSGVTSAVGGITGGIMQNYTKSMETAAKKEGNMGTGSALSEIFKTYGTEDQYNTFMAGWQENSSNPDREAGYIAMHQKTGQALVELNKSRQIADIYGANNKDLAMWKAGNTGTAVAEPKLDANYARQAYQSLRSRNYTHEQAIEGMNAGGMNWGVQYINRPESNSFWGSNP